MLDISRFNAKYLKDSTPEIFELAGKSQSLDELRQSISQLAHRMEYETFDDYDSFAEGSIIRVRDCARVLNRILTRRSEDLAHFSVVKAIRDIALSKPRSDLTPAFYADLRYIFLGLQGKGPGRALTDMHLTPSNRYGREAATERSKQLDELSEDVKSELSKFSTGLSEESIARRKIRRDRILGTLNASTGDWNDWNWQVDNILRDADTIGSLLEMSAKEKEAINNVTESNLPFGITPYYLSLMDDDTDSGRDKAIRAQVIPPATYLDQMVSTNNEGKSCLDFMRENDTSPVNLITRRYPEICIFKPFNTCPQICVYCQRNWEIEDAMEPDALASDAEIETALKWIEEHPAIHEVLITGGDPLAMSDKNVERIIDGVARIPTIERIRIGSRTLVTVPMRMTDKLVDLLAQYRIPGKRQVALVTHIQHPYELTPDTTVAVEKLLTRGIPVYNQLVYTFFVSRRFEAAFLRRMLALVGIEPYYTFNAKGKNETVDYRVPIARLQQEQKEEARLLPGLSRTDEAVFNVPGLGKSYLRARQHRDLISILPTGARLYEFHPWEKNISRTGSTYVCEDVPILDYLQRLDEIGEDISKYGTIWYYF